MPPRRSRKSTWPSIHRQFDRPRRQVSAPRPEAGRRGRRSLSSSPDVGVSDMTVLSRKKALVIGSEGNIGRPLVGRMPCEQAAGLAVSTNVAGINNVLQLCKRAKARCVFFSSSEVYGPHCDPMDEVHSVPRPNNRYALTKWLGEQLVEYEVKAAGLKAVTLRPCMIYHEHETVGEHRSAMIRFVSNLAHGRPIQVHRGSARSWLHVADAVRAIEAAGRLDQYAVINLGHPDIVPMADLAEMIRARLNASPELVVTT